MPPKLQAVEGASSDPDVLHAQLLSRRGKQHARDIFKGKGNASLREAFGEVFHGVMEWLTMWSLFAKGSR